MSARTLPSTATISRGRLRREQGVVLVVALILLVVITLFGLSGLRLVTQEERMVGQTYDRSLAFQAAEAALRQAESAVEVIKPTPSSGSCTDETSGVHTLRICPTPGATETRWTDAAFTGWTTATAVGTGTLAITPQYFAEYLGSTFPCGFEPTALPLCKRYRITARAGGEGRAAAMVQSIYSTD